MAIFAKDRRVSNYSVAAGEEVIITRHGKPVAELKPTAKPVKMPSKEAFDRLREGREALGSVGITSVELLNLIYEEPEA